MPPALRNGRTIGRAAFSWIDDHNEPGAVGAGRMPMNVRGGRRVTTADAYLPPGETPSNLTIRADSPVDCVIFAGTTAVGVRLADGTVVEGGRIVLCAGVYGSPAILLRSGIGRQGDRVDLPGVGKNLVDEYIVSCGELGIAVTVYEPIAAGILSNKTMEHPHAMEPVGRIRLLQAAARARQGRAQLRRHRWAASDRGSRPGDDYATRLGLGLAPTRSRGGARGEQQRVAHA